MNIRKEKAAHQTVVSKKSHNKYKDFLLNKKCLRHSMNKIQSRNHKIGTREISLPCFDDEIYIIDNETDELTLGT